MPPCLKPAGRGTAALRAVAACPEDGCRIEPTPSGPAPGAKYTSEISIGPPSFNRRNEDDYETWSQGKSSKRTLHAHKHDLTGPPDSAAAFPSTG